MSEDLLNTYKREVGDLKREIDDLKKALDKRESENKGYRDTIKTLEGEAETLKDKVPADGSVVLSKTAAEVLEGYKALGKLDEVKAALEAKSTAEQRLQQMERADTIRSAGFNPKALGRLIGDAGVKVTGEGDERKVLLVTGDQESDLNEWAEAEGIVTLLNAARLEPDAPRQTGVPAAGQAGRREQGRMKTSEERLAEKRNDPIYSL